MSLYIYWAFIRNKVRIAAARLGIGTHYDSSENEPDTADLDYRETLETYRRMK